MRALRVELLRLRSRRAVWVLLILAAVACVVVVGFSIKNASPPSAAARASAQAAVDQQIADPGFQQLAACQNGTDPSFGEGFDCEQLKPQVEWYLGWSPPDKPQQIDEVVLVGGSTRIPKVRALVEELFQRKPHTDLNPDEVVALGAAVQANILGGGSEATENMLLLDVTPLSLGIEVAGGVTDKIILRNSTIPASATQYYTTQIDGQANVAIHVLQGERELAKDCRSLARFDLKGIPPMTAGMPRIEVKFLIDANGILHVSAREQRSGKESEIEVQPSYGLTDDQVESMILDSFDYAEEDFRQRQLIEARNEADTILAALEKGKTSPAWGQLTSDEKKKIAKLEKALVQVQSRR